MLRDSTPDRRVVGSRSRLVRTGVFGSLVLVGALLLLGTLNPGAVGPSPSARDHHHDQTSYALQHEAAVIANVSNPTRSHRVVFAGAFLTFAGLAALVARRRSSSRHLISRPRLEQFHIRRRGPPVLRIAL